MLCSTAAAALSALLATSSLLVQGYDTGAPASQCQSLATGHGQESQNPATAPYTVKVSSSGVGPGVGVSVELSSPGGSTPFRGFILQARDTATDQPVGYFTLDTASTQAKYLTCSGVRQSAITHLNSQEKRSVGVTWQAESSYEGRVRILATVVQTYDIFWSRIPSQEIEISKRFGGSVTGGSQVLAQPLGTSAAPTSANSQVYTGCGSKKTCFGIPAGCVEARNCRYLATWTYAANKMMWEAFKTESTGYVAIGLSRDTKMGSDLVLACQEDGMRQYYNQGKSPVPVLPTPLDLVLEGTAKVDGNLYCRFTSPARLSGGGQQFDLTGGQFYPLLAGGAIEDSTIQYHDEKIAGGIAVDFTAVAAVGAASDLIMRFHGFIMMAAWLGCAGTGMVIARYFKGTWKKRQVLGKDLWFQVHRSLMVLTVVLNLLAIILICAYAGAWPYDTEFIRDNPHPAIGVATVILAFIQPIMAFFRPHPGTKFRPIFNWAHWLVGNSAFTLALACIFLAGYLNKMRGINVGGYIACLIVFVIFHFIVNLILTILNVFVENKEKKAEIHPMSSNGKSDPHLPEPGRGEDSPGSAWRQIILLTYIVGVAAIVIAIACLIFLYT